MITFFVSETQSISVHDHFATCLSDFSRHVDTDGMVKVTVSKQQRDRSKTLRQDMPNAPRNSIRDGGGSLWGVLGEVVAADFYKVPNASTYDYDIIVPAYNEAGDLIGRVKVDVKTKDRNVAPDPVNFDATVSAYNTKQKAHYYLFASTQKPGWQSEFDDTHTCYLIGLGRKDQVFADGNFRKQGSIDPNASQRQIKSGTGTNRCDCYSVKYGKLTAVREDGRIVLTQADIDYFIASGMPLLPAHDVIDLPDDQHPLA